MSLLAAALASTCLCRFTASSLKLFPAIVEIDIDNRKFSLCSVWPWNLNRRVDVWCIGEPQGEKVRTKHDTGIGVLGTLSMAKDTSWTLISKEQQPNEPSRCVPLYLLKSVWEEEVSR